MYHVGGPHVGAVRNRVVPVLVGSLTYDAWRRTGEVPVMMFLVVIGSPRFREYAHDYFEVSLLGWAVLVFAKASTAPRHPRPRPDLGLLAERRAAHASQ